LASGLPPNPVALERTHGIDFTKSRSVERAAFPG
jgi:hypothetical protein